MVFTEPGHIALEEESATKSSVNGTNPKATLEGTFWTLPFWGINGLRADVILKFQWPRKRLQYETIRVGDCRR